VVIGVIL